MDQVADNVYIGDYEDAQQEERLQAAGIDTVINLSKRESPSYNGIASIHIPLSDSWANEQAEFDEAFETVLEAISQDQTVLVHCNMGVSRSVSVTAAALAARDDATLRATLRRIEQHRPQANPHPRLVEQAEDVLERQ